MLDVKHYLFQSDEQTCVRSVSHDEEHDTLLTGDNECEGNNYRTRDIRAVRAGPREEISDKALCWGELVSCDQRSGMDHSNHWAVRTSTSSEPEK